MINYCYTEQQNYVREKAMIGILQREIHKLVT